jgi:hypothetical protein
VIAPWAHARSVGGKTTESPLERPWDQPWEARALKGGLSQRIVVKLLSREHVTNCFQSRRFGKSVKHDLEQRAQIEVALPQSIPCAVLGSRGASECARAARFATSAGTTRFECAGSRGTESHCRSRKLTPSVFDQPASARSVGN